MKIAAIIRHVHFEDLGTFEKSLAKAGYEVQYYDIGRRELPDPAAPDLLVVLGAPVGVYEDDKYPFLLDELALLKARLARGQPALGICLGAQLIAHALESIFPVTRKSALAQSN